MKGSFIVPRGAVMFGAVALLGVACGGRAERNAEGDSDDDTRDTAAGGSAGSSSSQGSGGSSGNATTAAGGASAGGTSASAATNGSVSSVSGGAGGASATLTTSSTSTGVGGASPAAGYSIFVLEALSDLEGLAFFDHPWPSNARLDASGNVVFTGYPNPFESQVIADYLTTMQGRLEGFSPVAAGQLRFSVALDPQSLPANAVASASETSSVQLIDITQGSPEYGRRKLISLAFREAGGAYFADNTLSFMPALGQPLLPATSYALVVTTGVLDTAGNPLEPGPELAELLEGEAPPGGEFYADAIDTLNAIGMHDILHLAAFTTNDPTREAFAVRDATTEQLEPPSASGWTAAEQVAGVYDAYEGSLGPSPDFQAGTPPFWTVDDGGEIEFDAGGVPVVQREFDQRFVLAVPTSCPKPASGYPVVLYAHGTGGNYRSALSTGMAAAFAAECLATLSIDQIFHGTRAGGELGVPDLLYFNLQNPLAARTNGAQSALDFVQLARLVTETGVAVPADVARTASVIDFDPERVLFFGHSQGGLNGPIFLASDDQVRGGVMSGAAAVISVALLDKTQPLALRDLLAAILGLTGDQVAELDPFHPALALAQSIADPSDGIHYARYAALSPRSGFPAKSLLMTEGVRPDGTGDSYAPPRGIEALAAASGLPTRLPEIYTSAFAEWSGLAPLMVGSAGVSGNLAAGTASGALLQYDADLASDGHFVAFEVDAAKRDVAQFLRSLAEDPVGLVPGG